MGAAAAAVQASKQRPQPSYWGRSLVILLVTFVLLACGDEILLDKWEHSCLSVSQTRRQADGKVHQRVPKVASLMIIHCDGPWRLLHPFYSARHRLRSPHLDFHGFSVEHSCRKEMALTLVSKFGSMSRCHLMVAKYL